MMHDLRRRLNPELNADSQSAPTAYWLYPLLGIMFVVMFVLLVATPFSPMTVEDKAGITILNAATLALCIGLYLLARSGRIRLAAIGLVASVYIGATVPSIFMFGTIRAPNITGFFVLVPLAALLLGKRAIGYVVALSVVSVALIYLLEVSGFIRPNMQTAAGIDIILMAIGVNAALLYWALRNAEISAARAQRAADVATVINGQLIQSQAELQAIKAQLEARVLQRTAELDEANRKLREEIDERLQSELRFRGLAEHSPDLILILDQTSRQWVYANRRQVFDHPIEHLASQSAVAAWIHPDDLPAVEARWHNLGQVDDTVTWNSGCSVWMAHGNGCRVAKLH